MSIYVYMVRCADGSFYVGSATGEDLEPRIERHNAGSYPGYTFTRRPVVLVWSEHFERITDGIAVERQLKGWGRAKKRSVDTLGLGDHQPTGSTARRLGEQTSRRIIQGVHHHPSRLAFARASG
jgi:putative endonuclease